MSSAECHAISPDCGETSEPVLSGDWLGVPDCGVSGFSSRRWAAFPSSLVRLLCDVWSAPRQDEKQSDLLERRERSLLALGLMTIGVRMPAPEPDDAFLGAFALAAADVRKMMQQIESADEKRRRALARMRDVAERAARLCGGGDVERWGTVVRRLGLRRFLPVLEKAESMKRDEVPDKEGKPIRCWPAYFAEMLRDAIENENGKNGGESEKD